VSDVEQEFNDVPLMPEHLGHGETPVEIVPAPEHGFIACRDGKPVAGFSTSAELGQWVEDQWRHLDPHPLAARPAAPMTDAPNVITQMGKDAGITWFRSKAKV
jgi:hypothetical protein